MNTKKYLDLIAFFMAVVNVIAMVMCFFKIYKEGTRAIIMVMSALLLVKSIYSYVKAKKMYKTHPDLVNIKICGGWILMYLSFLGIWGAGYLTSQMYGFAVGFIGLVLCIVSLHRILTNTPAKS